jgi:hypothetical protein
VSESEETLIADEAFDVAAEAGQVRLTVRPDLPGEVECSMPAATAYWLGQRLIKASVAAVTAE